MQQRLHIKLGNVLLEELPMGLLATPIGKSTHGQPIPRAQILVKTAPEQLAKGAEAITKNQSVIHHKDGEAEPLASNNPDRDCLDHHQLSST
jgi:hypothetical protein